MIQKLLFLQKKLSYAVTTFFDGCTKKKKNRSSSTIFLFLVRMLGNYNNVFGSRLFRSISLK